ncbi:TetR/AcrR family transcriptional regulator [Streptomyces sp. NPDC018031]|uniref:TetR/AcrR family transcriptional regulator n=1 Tax=Streptomyces sp. NPDC018031 TaxID=3365033 RepID=UPI0037AA23E8
MTGAHAVHDPGNPPGEAKVRGTGPTRTDRRRARTRGALIAAARSILSDQGPADVSIQQITNRADVGFGSFYNHFGSKAELFEAAVADAMEEYGALLDERTAHLGDPAEVFAVGVRLTGRLADTHPQVARILLRTGPVSMRVGDAMPPRALCVIERGVAAGRFRVADPQVALAGVAGCLLGLLELRMSGAGADGRPGTTPAALPGTTPAALPAAYGVPGMAGVPGAVAMAQMAGAAGGFAAGPGAPDDLCEQMAELLLRMLGVAADEAAEVARRPLPDCCAAGLQAPVPA